MDTSQQNPLAGFTAERPKSLDLPKEQIEAAKAFVEKVASVLKGQADTKEGAQPYAMLLAMGIKFNDLETEYEKKVVEMEKQFGKAEGEIRALAWIEGALVMISWVVGIEAQGMNPLSFLKARLSSTGLYACPDPSCESCQGSRELADKRGEGHRSAPLGEKRPS